jgi:peptidoglycan/xylan/chitin deacetylase (PgdA/CDA1 family)
MNISTCKFWVVALLFLICQGSSDLVARTISASDVAIPVSDEMATAEGFKDDYHEMIHESLADTELHFGRSRLVRLLSQTKKVVLTFDDGPHPRTTPKILEILKKRNLKAIFFVLGIQVEKYPELVKQIYLDGHEIGNHSYNHKNFTKITDAELIEQIDKTSNLIREITGKAPRLLRPPYGAMNTKVLALAKMRNMSLVLWTIDPKDWKNKNEHIIVHNVKHQLGLTNRQRGGVLLLHDIYPSTVRALNNILDQIAINEYQITSIHEIDSKNQKFWTAADPRLLKSASFFKEFEPEITEHDLLVNMFKEEYKYQLTAMAMLKANRSGNLLMLLKDNSFASQ